MFGVDVARLITPVAPLITRPEGNAENVPPVAPVVVNVIGVRAVLIQSVGEAEAALTVLFGVTVMLPVALTFPQPPVRGMV